MQKFVLFGCGGHAKVLIDLIERLNSQVEYCFDADHPYDESQFPNAKIIVAVGNNETRKKLVSQISHDFGVLIHPTAVVGKNVYIGEGSVILANTVIQSGSTIGKHCIINANVVIDHDVLIEDYASIYPGAYVGGEAKVTSMKTIEPNQVVPRNSVL